MANNADSARTPRTLTEREQRAVAVGTGLSSKRSAPPPHTTRRAALPHRAPTFSPGVETPVRPRYLRSGRRNPAEREPVHPLPVQHRSLAALPQLTALWSPALSHRPALTLHREGPGAFSRAA